MSEFCHSGGASMVQNSMTNIVAGSSSLKVLTSQISVLRLTIFGVSKRPEYSGEFNGAYGSKLASAKGDLLHMSGLGRGGRAVFMEITVRSSSKMD